jgi:hypothetical protein
MSNNENTKININSSKLDTAEFYTLRSDLSNVDVAEKESEVIADADNTAKNSSSFSSGFDKNIEKTESIPLKKEVGADTEKIENNNLWNLEKVVPVVNYSNAPVNDFSYVSDDSIEKNEVIGRGNLTFIYVVVFLIILVLGAVAYYLLMGSSRNDIKNTILDSYTSLTGGNKSKEDNNLNVAETQPIGDLSKQGGFSDKVNFFTINENELNKSSIDVLIDKKFSEMTGDYTNNLLEFLLVDKDNKPIFAKSFINSFKINLSSGIVDNLMDDNFSLFFLKKGDNKKLGLVFGIKNKEVLVSALAKSEIALVSDLASLFKFNEIDKSVAINFKTSEYRGNKIRYINLNKKSDLSLDYLIVGNYLIFGTSMDSTRFIADKIMEEDVKKSDIFKEDK